MFKVFYLLCADEKVWDEELVHSFVDNDDVEGVLNMSLFNVCLQTCYG